MLLPSMTPFPTPVGLHRSTAQKRTVSERETLDPLTGTIATGSAHSGESPFGQNNLPLISISLFK